MMRKISPFLVAGFMLSIAGCVSESGIVSDLCPDDPEKTEPGVCGCGVSDEDTNQNGIPDCLEEGMDLCPDDPEKEEPGVCGCGVSDEDTNQNGIPDCLEEGMDLCPDDPEKEEPGVCGCGVADVDSDGDGVYACHDACDEDPDKVKPGICGCGVSDVDSDGDGTVDCLDLCPQDPGKVEPGICGCGHADEGDNIADNDGDGAVNCIDLCPDNPIKTEPGQGDCSWGDTDGDLVPDAEDACIYNPLVSAPGEDCNYIEEDGVKIFQIWTAGDLARLTTELTGRETIDEANIFKVRLMRDINLNEAYRIDIHDDVCVTDFSSILLRYVDFDGNGHTIRFTSDSGRCAITKPIFANVLYSQVYDLNVDIDLRGRPVSGFSKLLVHSTLRNINWNGSYISDYHSLYGESGSIFSLIAVRAISSTIENLRHTGSVQALDVQYSGLVNALASEQVSGIEINLSEFMSLSDAVIGFNTIGTSSVNGAKINIEHIKAYNGQYKGVFGTLSSEGTVDDLELKIKRVDNLTPNEIPMVGYISGGTLSHLDVEVDTIRSHEKVYGLVAEIEEGGTVSDVNLKLNHVNADESVYGVCYRNNGTISDVTVQSEDIQTKSSFYGVMYQNYGVVNQVHLDFDKVKSGQAFYGFSSDNYKDVTEFVLDIEELETISGNINGFANSNKQGSLAEKIHLNLKEVKASKDVYGFGYYNEGTVNHLSMYGDIYLPQEMKFLMMGIGVFGSSFSHIVASSRVRHFGNYDSETGYSNLTNYALPYCFGSFGDIEHTVSHFYYRVLGTQSPVIDSTNSATGDNFISFEVPASDDDLNNMVSTLNSGSDGEALWTLVNETEDGTSVKVPELK